MVKRICSIIVMIMMVVTVCAQEETDKGSRDLNRSYFLQLTGGANYDMNENTRFFKMREIIQYGGKLSFGMGFNPYWGTSLQLGYNRNPSIYDTGGTFMRKDFNSVEMFLNGTYNLSNAIGGYKPNRKNHVHAYLGIGVGYSFGTNPFTHADFNEVVPGFTLGFNYSYMFNQRIAAIADLGFYGFTDNYNHIDYDLPLDCRLNAQIGIRVYVNRNGARKWTPEPEIRYVDRIVYKTDTVYMVQRVVEEVIKESPNKVETVFFAINSTEVQRGEKAKVQEIADYLKNHPSSTVLVIGSADKQTGNEKINTYLRANRARVVAEMLVNEFGIEKSRVKPLMGKGVKEDLYQKQYEKNRAAICVITELQYE